MPFTHEVAGVSGGFLFTGSDAISPDLMQAFLNNIKVLYGYGLGGDASSSSPLNWSNAELAQFQSSLNTLIAMGKSGYPILNDAIPPAVIGTAYMPVGMVEAVNKLLKTLSAAGASDLSALSRQDLQNWVDLNVQNGSLQDAFANIARLYVRLPSSSGTTYSTDPSVLKTQLNSVLRVSSVTLANEALARGVQAFTELEYIGAANEVITETLKGLRDNLSTTKNVLDSLTALQNLHNAITVSNRSNPFNYTFFNGAYQTSDAEYQRNYESYSNAWLKEPIVPQLSQEINPWTLLQTGQAMAYRQYNFGAGGAVASVTYRMRIEQNPPQYAWYNPDNNLVGANTDYEFVITLPPSDDLFAGLPPNTWASPSLIDPTKLQKLVEYTNGAVHSPNDPPGNARGYLMPVSALESLKMQMIGLRSTLATQIAFLSRPSVTPLSTQNDPTKRSLSLLGQLSTVYTDLVTNLTVNGVPVTSGTSLNQAATGIRNWIMDNYQSFTTAGGTNAGKIQQNLTTAITSAESTNDVQKERVRNYLFVFEEYYKSASSILTSLNQMISKMAQNINR